MNGLVLLALLAPLLAQAQVFPSKLVKVQVPFSSSAGPTVFMQVLADKLSKAWGERVIVEPKPGASGFLAIESVKHAAPDGHELLIVSNSHVAINPALYKKLPYDPQMDFVPVALIYRAPYFVTVSASGPYPTVPALIAAAKANPGKLTYGIAFVGSPPHLGGALFGFLTSTDMAPVAFKEQNQLYVALANGDLSWALSTIGSALPLMKAGKVKLIAVAAASRSPLAPEIPTIAEAGGPAGAEVEAWLAMLAPRGTPAGVVRRINADVVKQLGDADVLERMRVLGFQATPDSPEEVARLIREDTRKYGELVRKVGATAD
ncbi:MAG TPA: tripartite tricarboxylate transporter substrate-binding protein [Burkholderiales bacterium]